MTLFAIIQVFSYLDYFVSENLYFYNNKTTIIHDTHSYTYDTKTLFLYFYYSATPSHTAQQPTLINYPQTKSTDRNPHSNQITYKIKQITFFIKKINVDNFQQIIYVIWDSPMKNNHKIFHPQIAFPSQPTLTKAIIISNP